MTRFNCSSVKYRCFDLGGFPRFSSSHDIQTFRPSTSLSTPTIFRIDFLESLYVLMSSIAIVRERETGTLEQLNVTPLRRWELIVGKLLPYGFIALVDVLLVVAVAVFWFEVPLRGSFALLFGLSIIYVLCTLALGLFISTISNTQQQAMMTATFFFLTPMIYLSGFIFPIENMPALIQVFTYLIPLRYYLVIVRGIFLKGIGLELLWPQAAAMTVWGVVVLSLAVARSTKRAQ
jgi:ABC-2 type transport system permease protein